MEEAHWWYGATRALLTDVLSPYLDSSERVLDAGGGTGATGAWLGEHGHHEQAQGPAGDGRPCHVEGA